MSRVDSKSKSKSPWSIFRIKGGVSWTVKLRGHSIVAFATRKEAQRYIEEMDVKYGALI